VALCSVALVVLVLCALAPALEALACEPFVPDEPPHAPSVAAASVSAAKVAVRRVRLCVRMCGIELPLRWASSAQAS
jgi:hypothetical protein